MQPKPAAVPDPQMDLPPSLLRSTWTSVRSRVLGGLLLVLPILITFWVLWGGGRGKRAIVWFSQDT